MFKNKFKLFIFMLAIGFVLITLDVNVTTPFKYPHKYNNSGSVIGEFQYYNIASNYNAWCDYKVINTSSEKADENSHYNTTNDNKRLNWHTCHFSVLTLPASANPNTGYICSCSALS